MKHKPAQFHSLLHSSDIIERKLATLLSTVGIPPRQARVLNTLKRLGAASQVELAEGFGVTAGSMSTMIDRLLTAGLIVRHKNPKDKRGDIVALAPRGEKVIVEIRSIWRDVDEMIVAAIGAEKAQQLAEMTRELKFALGGKIPAQGRKHRELSALLSEHQDLQVDGDQK